MNEVKATKILSLLKAKYKKENGNDPRFSKVGTTKFVESDFLIYSVCHLEDVIYGVDSEDEIPSADDMFTKDKN